MKKAREYYDKGRDGTKIVKEFTRRREKKIHKEKNGPKKKRLIRKCTN